MRNDELHQLNWQRLAYLSGFLADYISNATSFLYSVLSYIQFTTYSGALYVCLNVHSEKLKLRIKKK